MYNLYKLILKNFKLLLRSKASALIVIFGPLLIIFLVGLAFDNTNTYSINIGVYSSSYSADTNSFIEKLNQNEFSVVKVDTEDMCLNEIKRGKLHTCIVFPPDLNVQNTDLKNEVVFYVDYSKMNLVYMVMDTLTEKLQSRSSEISKDLTNTILEKLDETRVDIFNQNPKIAEVTSNLDEQKISIDTAKGSLEGVDLSFDSEAFEMAQLQDLSSGVKSRVAELKTYLLDRIDDAKDDVGYARNHVGDAINASASSLIDADLDSIDSNLDQAENQTNKLTNLNIDNLNQIISYINSADAQVSAVQNKISNAASVRSDTNSRLDSVKTSIESTKTTMAGIQETLAKIDSNIASIPVVNADSIVSPITTTIKPISVKKTHLNYLFPSLIVLVIMFISILLASTLVMMEKHSPAYFRNFITPVSNFTYVVSIYLTTLILIAVQLVIIMGISSYFFKAQILTNIQNISLMLFLLSSVFILLGMFIGYIFNSEETGTLASISAGAVFLLLSDLIIPLESMPAYVFSLVKFNPFVIGQNILRKTIIFGQGIDMLSDEIYLLFIYSLVILFLIFCTYSFSRQTFFSRWRYRRMKKKEELKKEIKKKEKKIVKSSKKKSGIITRMKHDEKHDGGGFFKYLRKK